LVIVALWVLGLTRHETPSTSASPASGDAASVSAPSGDAVSVSAPSGDAASANDFQVPREIDAPADNASRSPAHPPARTVALRATVPKASRVPARQDQPEPEPRAAAHHELESTPEREAIERRWEQARPDVTRDRAMLKRLEDAAERAGIAPDFVHQLDCRGEVCRMQLRFGHPRDAVQLQAQTRRPDFGHDVLPTTISGPLSPQMLSSDYSPDEPWEIELLAVARADATAQEEPSDFEVP
jgi:hypothetical protein